MAENFYYIEGNTSVKNIINTIITEITQNAGDTYKWTLEYPADLASVVDYAIVSTKNIYCDKKFYTKFERSGTLTPTADEQKIIDKYNNSLPLTSEQYTLLQRYIGSLDLGVISANIGISLKEDQVFKKDPGTRTSAEISFLQFVRLVRNITDDYEANLIYEYLNGTAMSASDQQNYQNYKQAHALSATELAEITKLKSDRKFYTDNIIVILLKENMGPALLSDSDMSTLASYRQSMELTNAEMQIYVNLQSNMENLNHISITIGTAIGDKNKILPDGSTTTIKDLVDDQCSLPSRFAWYRNLDDSIGDWLPLQYWINQTKDSINIVLRGDPSADYYPYDNYLTSWAHIGAIKPIEDGAYTDDIYNFGVTCSSDMQPAEAQYKFGPKTGNGVTDYCMVANKVGLPYQAHDVGFYATNPYRDKCLFEGSRWNLKKHQFSDVTITHSIDGERGKLQNVLVGDASGIYDTDRLSYKKGLPEEEMYRKFKINAPYWLLNNSANNLYAIAIRIPVISSE